MGIKVIKSFDKWITKLKDKKLRSVIFGRYYRMKLGDFGDYKSIKGVSNLYELCIHYQNGCRIYFTWNATDIVILLCGGSKSD